MGFYHTETNRDIHQRRPVENKKFRMADIAVPSDTWNIENKEREKQGNVRQGK